MKTSEATMMGIGTITPLEPELTPIKREAAKRGIAFLQAAGVPFAAFLDGQMVGTLKAAVPAARTRAANEFDHIAKHDYANRMADAKSGDLVTFKVDSDREGDSLRGSIAAWCGRTPIFGPENVMTEFRRGTGVVSALVIHRSEP